MSAIVVSGVLVWSEVILQADTLTFDNGSTLLLAPSQDKGGPLPTTLTIITNEIILQGNATITYSFDGAPGPAYDPGTPARPQTGTALNGIDGASMSGTGSFPQAANGGDGGPGMTGQAGNAGIDAPELQIFVGAVKQASPGGLTIDFKGQDGGKAGDGGNGGKGGNGQTGSPSTTSSSWYDNSKCTQMAGKGGNGGAGGDAGYPGKGGYGGNGGIVNVFTLAPSLSTVQSWNYIVSGGKGAPPGNPGTPGTGGSGGAQGSVNSPCPSTPGFDGSDGASGQTMAQIDPTWPADYSGSDGLPGYAAQYKMTAVPS
jgi:hypothetical protein